MVAVTGRGWSLAPCLVSMVREANQIAPNRNRRADGSIGDAAHRNRTSDHNPSSGWVCAVDLTHAPSTGFDAHARAREVIANRDLRIKYVISNGQIARAYSKPGIPAWTWVPYHGSNQHKLHAHFSVNNTPASRDDTSPWWPTNPPEEEIVPELEIIKAFADWLGRPPSDSELANHVAYAAYHGIDKAALNIARSSEAQARR